jgi:hypothetical protein
MSGWKAEGRSMRCPREGFATILDCSCNSLHAESSSSDLIPYARTTRVQRNLIPVRKTRRMIRSSRLDEGAPSGGGPSAEAGAASHGRARSPAVGKPPAATPSLRTDRAPEALEPPRRARRCRAQQQKRPACHPRPPRPFGATLTRHHPAALAVREGQGMAVQLGNVARFRYTCVPRRPRRQFP